MLRAYGGSMAARDAVAGVATALGVALLMLPPPPAGGVAIASAREDSPTLAVGDSVMLGAQPCLERRGFHVDAQGSRNVRAVPPELGRYRPLPDIVVVHAGTNGGAERWQFDAIMDTIGRKRQVVFVTVQLPDGTPRYTFEASTNKAIRALPSAPVSQCPRRRLAGALRRAPPMAGRRRHPPHSRWLHRVRPHGGGRRAPGHHPDESVRPDGSSRSTVRPAWFMTCSSAPASLPR